jgi:hypothetical protein
MKTSASFPRFFQVASAFAFVALVASCSKESVEPMASGQADNNARRVVLIDKEDYRSTRPVETKDASVRQYQITDQFATDLPIRGCGGGAGQASEALDPGIDKTFREGYVEMAAPSGLTYPDGPAVKDPTIQHIRHPKAKAKKIVFEKR